MPKEKQEKLEIDKVEPNNPQAIKLLEDAMIFWHGRGQKLIKDLIQALYVAGEIKLAANIVKQWRDVDDRWIDIAAKLSPYQAPKLSSMEVNKNETKRFVIVAPRVVSDQKEWLKQAEQEQAALPKSNVIAKVIQDDMDDEIDEAQYVDVNEY